MVASKRCAVIRTTIIVAEWIKEPLVDELASKLPKKNKFTR